MRFFFPSVLILAAAFMFSHAAIGAPYVVYDRTGSIAVI